MTQKRERFYSTIEEMKSKYRRFATERLIAITRRGTTKEYVLAAKAVLKERKLDY